MIVVPEGTKEKLDELKKNAAALIRELSSVAELDDEAGARVLEVANQLEDVASWFRISLQTAVDNRAERVTV